MVTTPVKQAAQLDLFCAGHFDIVALDRHHARRVPRPGMTVIGDQTYKATGAKIRSVINERRVGRDNHAVLVVGQIAVVGHRPVIDKHAMIIEAGFIGQITVVIQRTGVRQCAHGPLTGNLAGSQRTMVIEFPIIGQVVLADQAAARLVGECSIIGQAGGVQQAAAGFIGPNYLIGHISLIFKRAVVVDPSTLVGQFVIVLQHAAGIVDQRTGVNVQSAVVGQCGSVDQLPILIVGERTGVGQSSMVGQTTIGSVGHCAFVRQRTARGVGQHAAVGHRPARFVGERTGIVQRALILHRNMTVG